MKRIALVVALGAAFAAPAFAQSSVTVYGRLNTSGEWQDNIGVDDDRYVLQNNASRIGFKGVEDLGGGLKADFFLEHRFNSDNGAQTQDRVLGWRHLGGPCRQFRLGAPGPHHERRLLRDG